MSERTDNLATGIKGAPVKPIADERDHFYTCQACGQAVDMRDLGEVFHHEGLGHKPLPEN